MRNIEALNDHIVLCGGGRTGRQVMEELMALGQDFVVIERETILSDKARASRGKPGWGATFEGIRETLVHWKEIIWTSLLGLVIGVIPGAGAAIASFVAYQQSRTFSKTPELYGTGHINGLIAPESANNGVTSGTLIPLLMLLATARPGLCDVPLLVTGEINKNGIFDPSVEYDASGVVGGTWLRRLP